MKTLKPVWNPSTEKTCAPENCNKTQLVYLLGRIYCQNKTDKRYYPGLMTFIMAGAASGKGIAEHETLFVSLPEEFSTGECIALAGKMGASEKTARRWIDNWIEVGALIKTQYGHFAKIA